MNSLPVITRELQVQARQPATNRMRWIAAAVVMGIWLVLMLVGGRATPQERAGVIFVTIGIASLGFVLLAGVFQTADCLSEERREGTLGLLFLTDLKGYDIVLGKLASTSLHSFYTFLAIIPVLSFPFLMGGITVGEFWRVTLVLMVTLYLSLAVGMFVSALSRDARLAMGVTFVVLFTLAGLMPLLCWLVESGGGAIKLGVLLWACPPFAFQGAFHDAYTAGQGAEVFWYCIATMLMLGTVALVGASWILPGRWQDNTESKAGKAEERRTYLKRALPACALELLNRQPFLWLVLRDSRPRRMAVMAFAIMLPAWGFFYGRLWFTAAPALGNCLVIVMLLTYAMHLILKGVIAVEVTRQFSEDRHSGALEILLVSPIPVPEMLKSQARAIWRSFRGWAILLTLLNFAVIGFAIQSDLFRRNDETITYLILTMAGGIILLFLDGVALVNVGMWMALVKKRHARAFLGALQRVLLPPWLVGIILYMIGLGGGGLRALTGPMILWFCISFLTDVLVAIPALNKLQHHFRQVVALGKLETKPVATVMPADLFAPLADDNEPGLARERIATR